MREMKDSGIEWIGNIPSNWTRAKIKNICSLIGSGTTPASHNQDYYEGDINWIQSGDLYGTSIINNTQKKISTKTLESFSSLKLYKPPFISIAMYGASVGNLAISTIKACCNQAVCCLKTNDNIVKNNYLFYWLNISKTDFLSMAEGGTQPNISQQKIRNQYIYIPRIVEQQKIADFLDEKCAEIDALTTDIQTQIETLEEYKKSVITEAVTKGLDPNVEMKDSGVKWIGNIPEKWAVPKILYCLKMPITDGPHTTPALYDEGIPFVSAEAVSFGRGSIDFTHIRGYISNEFYRECCKKYIPSIGDIFMIKSGATTGKVSIVDTDKIFTIWSPLAVFRTNSSILKEKYLFYVLQSDYIQKQIQTRWSYGTQENIGMRVLEKLKITLPPINTQTEIADFLDQKCSEIDQTISEKQQQLETLAEYKKSLIYEYVTGKKEVA